MTHVLVVEDDEAYREVLARTLQAEGFSVTAASGVDAAIGAVRARPPDLALVDLRLSAGSGLDVVRHLAEATPGCRTVLLTGHGTIPAAVEAMRLGAVDFRTKPISSAELVEALRDALVPLPKDALERVERAHILGVLQACGGNVTEAARRLGLYRRTLQRKLQKLPR